MYRYVTCVTQGRRARAAPQRSFVPYAGASGATSRRPVSASNATAWTCPAEFRRDAARMSSNCARTLPPAAGATMPRSVIIMLIALPSPSGSRPSRRTTVPVRRFGFSFRSPPRSGAGNRTPRTGRPTAEARSLRTAGPGAPRRRPPRPGARAPPVPGQPHGPPRGGPAPRGPAPAAARSPPLDGHLLPQPLLEDPAPLARTQTGQLPVDLRRDLRPPGPPDVHHVAAVLALAARVQPDPVIAPMVRARLTLHQATPHQPRKRAVDQGLAAGLLQPVGEPVGQQPRPSPAAPASPPGGSAPPAPPPPGPAASVLAQPGQPFDRRSALLRRHLPMPASVSGGRTAVPEHAPVSTRPGGPSRNRGRTDAGRDPDAAVRTRISSAKGVGGFLRGRSF